jgi:SAM-dependent MidA family methyltransferase
MQKILKRIDDKGPLDFAEFMTHALYDPKLGYYARNTSQIGRKGDFFTSVSTGPLFGELLARRFIRHWHKIGKPQRWRVIEAGAHNGTLACDILTAIQKISPQAATTLEYAIAEPIESLRSAQATKLAAFASSIRLVADTLELADDRLPGIAFGNEVLDALPFHLVERRDHSWRELLVSHNADGLLTWVSQDAIDPALNCALASLGENFADAHRSEIRTNFENFLKPLSAALVHGLMIWIDYGFASADLHHPLRHSGTLRTFRRHRADDDPLADPGEKDITAHVDFSDVARAAMKLGGKAIEFHNQGAWLTEIARDWLTSREGNLTANEARQFQTLTHPAQLGGKFQVLEISWDPQSTSKDPASLARRLFPDEQAPHQAND